MDFEDGDLFGSETESEIATEVMEREWKIGKAEKVQVGKSSKTQ